MANNEKKEKLFFIVSLSKKDGPDSTVSDGKIWQDNGRLENDFFKLMEKSPEELTKEEKEFLLQLKVRATGCWKNGTKDFNNALKSGQDCYVMAKTHAKAIAIYKVVDNGIVEANDIIKYNKDQNQALLNEYMNLKGKPFTLKNDIKLKDFVLANSTNKDCYRYKVCDCEPDIIETYCKYAKKLKMQDGCLKTERQIMKEYLYTAESVKYNIKDLINKGIKQIVLTGAPGTGKTYLTEKIAEDLTEGAEEQIELVQFHAGYDYTDFVEGLKPVPTADGSVSFEVRDGSFRAFCRKAEKDPQNKYIFIIDEINRADLSKVFGELMYGLEYRNKPFSTQYSQWRNENDRKFKIPENVYIIGTMNDIDRSVETFDFALRRRFMWYEIKADDDYNETVISSIVGNDQAKKGLCEQLSKFSKTVNYNLIEMGKDYNITESHKIGPAYFDPYYIYKDAKENVSKDIIKEIKENINKDIWELRIEPVIKEYVRGYNDADKFVEKLREAVLK